jgi:RNase H-fold protein (predicted Holliday junction resolvase)
VQAPAGAAGGAGAAAPAAAALRLQCRVVPALVAAHGAAGVLVGHPLDPQGARAGAECAFAEALAARLAAALGGAGCAGALWDERGSSARARAGLRAARVAQRGGARPAQALPAALGGRIDEAAAVAILESFLAEHAL